MRKVEKNAGKIGNCKNLRAKLKNKRLAGEK